MLDREYDSVVMRPTPIDPDRLTRIVLFRRTGDVRFSGPGVPSLCVTPLINVPSVSAKMKSAALLFVSIGVWLGQTPPPGLPALPQTSREKLYWVVLSPTGGAVEPSRNRSQKPPVFAPKPTASRRFADEMASAICSTKHRHVVIAFNVGS